MDANINIPQEVRKEIEDFAAEVERRSRDNIDENGFCVICLILKN